MGTISDYNIYKSFKDVIAYVVLYIIIPVVQTYVYVQNNDTAVLIYVSLYLASIFYDAYTRDSEDLSPLGHIKTIIIRVICGFLVLFNLIVGLLSAGNVPISKSLFYIYLVLVFPLLFAVWDGIDHIRAGKYLSNH